MLREFLNFYEARLWQYSWQILHEVKREAANIYIEAAGGRSTLACRIDPCLITAPLISRKRYTESEDVLA